MTPRINGYRIDDLDAALARLGGRAARLASARIFITGGTGIIGQWLLALLVHARARAGLDFGVVALTRSSRGFLAAHPDFAGLDWLRFTDGDIRSFDFPGGAFSHVIHAAADTSLDAESRPLERAQTIIDGTRRVLDFAARAGARRLLYLSSGAVYGRQPASLALMDEKFSGAPDPLDTRNVYGEAKRAAEMYCAIAARECGLEPVIARIFAIAGPGLPLDAHFAVGNFIRDAMRGGPIRIAGDGTAVRSYLYTGDLAAWLLTLLIDGESGAAYNVGSDEAMTTAELAARVAAALGSSRRAQALGHADPDAPRSRYAPSISRARSEMGLDAWTPLDVAIQRTAEFSAWTRGTRAARANAR